MILKKLRKYHKRKIIVRQVGKVSRNQGAQIFINGVEFKRSFLDRLLGK